MEARYGAASPSHAVTAHLPPSLLIYGGKDHIIEAKFGQAMAERLRAAGNPVGLIHIPWAEKVKIPHGVGYADYTADWPSLSAGC